MVARGIVREARENAETQQVKLKEVRDRLDRVSRDDVQYLELATLEHKLLQVQHSTSLLLVSSMNPGMKGTLCLHFIIR